MRPSSARTAGRAPRRRPRPPAREVPGDVERCGRADAHPAPARRRGSSSTWQCRPKWSRRIGRNRVSMSTVAQVRDRRSSTSPTTALPRRGQREVVGPLGAARRSARRRRCGRRGTSAAPARCRRSGTRCRPCRRGPTGRPAARSAPGPAGVGESDLPPADDGGLQPVDELGPRAVAPAPRRRVDDRGAGRGLGVGPERLAAAPAPACAAPTLASPRRRPPPARRAGTAPAPRSPTGR